MEKTNLTVELSIKELEAFLQTEEGMKRGDLKEIVVSTKKENKWLFESIEKIIRVSSKFKLSDRYDGESNYVLIQNILLTVNNIFEKDSLKKSYFNYNFIDYQNLIFIKDRCEFVLKYQENEFHHEMKVQYVHEIVSMILEVSASILPAKTKRSTREMLEQEFNLTFVDLSNQ